MTADERYEKTQAFLRDFRKIVHRHAGSDFFKADTELLAMMQDATSVYQPWMWPMPKKKK